MTRAPRTRSADPAPVNLNSSARYAARPANERALRVMSRKSAALSARPRPVVVSSMRTSTSVSGCGKGRGSKIQAFIIANITVGPATPSASVTAATRVTAALRRIVRPAYRRSWTRCSSTGRPPSIAYSLVNATTLPSCSTASRCAASGDMPRRIFSSVCS